MIFQEIKRFPAASQHDINLQSSVLYYFILNIDRQTAEETDWENQQEERVYRWQSKHHYALRKTKPNESTWTLILLASIVLYLMAAGTAHEHNGPSTREKSSRKMRKAISFALCWTFCLQARIKSTHMVCHNQNWSGMWFAISGKN